MRSAKWSLVGLAVVLAWGIVMSARAQVGGKNKKTLPPSLKAGVAAATRYKEEAIDKVFKALGPALSDQLRAGREVELPGVGVFRVVQVQQYRDLVNGRPAVVPPRNYVEFVPNAGLDAIANAPGVRAARVVENAEFRVNPNAEGGIRVGPTRNIGTRTR